VTSKVSGRGLMSGAYREPAMAKLLLLAMAVAMACQSNQPVPTASPVSSASPVPSASPAPTVSIATARAELTALISDVTAADFFRYRALDDLGRWLGPTDIIWVPEAETFAAVYFTDSPAAPQRWHVQLATSADLATWTWRVELADQASQPSISESADGGYIVAWEQEPDPIYNVIAEYASWRDLLAAKTKRRFDVPITTPACGEGTPSIESVSSERVQIGFHYHASCERDLEAEGWTDWTTWHSSQRRSLDHALIDLGVEGHIGDRDTIEFRGHALMIIEGQRVLDDWSTWRQYLYDPETDAAEQLDIRTHARSVSMGNPSLTLIEVNGREALLVTLYIYSEGSHADEDGGLIYYRYL